MLGILKFMNMLHPQIKEQTTIAYLFIEKNQTFLEMKAYIWYEFFSSIATQLNVGLYIGFIFIVFSYNSSLLASTLLTKLAFSTVDVLVNTTNCLIVN